MPIRNAVGDLSNLQDDEAEAIATVGDPDEVLVATTEAGDSSEEDEDMVIAEAEVEDDVMADNDGLAGEEGGAAAAAADAAAAVPFDEPREGESEQARDLRLMHLRKGFRLSSMCWDD